MSFEQEVLQLKKMHLTPSQSGGHALVIETGRRYKLEQLPFTYLQVLQTPQSIEHLVKFFMGQGWLVSFRELYNLLHLLVQEQLILNPSVHTAFRNNPQNIFAQQPNGKSTQITGRLELDWKKLPFFRSLGQDLAHYLLQRKEILSVPAHTKLIQAGDTDRFLYIVLKGRAFIYYVQDQQKRQLMATLHEGSIFGERGFLLGQPRSADVMTSEPCEILKVHHLPEFDQFIKTEKAQALQQRFWVLQALAASPLFKQLPGDSLDQLMFSGKLCRASANQVIVREGAAGTSCFILIQGKVVVSREGKNINVLDQGSCFGEISLLFSGTRTATVTTQQDCILLEVHQKDFYRVLSGNLFLAREVEQLAVQRLEADQRRKAG